MPLLALLSVLMDLPSRAGSHYLFSSELGCFINCVRP